MQQLFRKISFLILGLIFSIGLPAQVPQNIIFCGLEPGGENQSAAETQPRIFRGKLFSYAPVIPVAETHNWYLYLEDETGKPMEGARIQASGINYDAGRGFGMPPRVEKYLGNGHYVVEQVTYNVPGTWTMYFQVVWQDKADVLSFDIEVPEAEGL